MIRTERGTTGRKGLGAERGEKPNSGHPAARECCSEQGTWPRASASSCSQLSAVPPQSIPDAGGKT